MRTYRCMLEHEFSYKNYTLIPIRDEDKFQIMDWRNDQIDILRQKKLLTLADQENYFANVISKLFDEERPDQVLFSVLEQGRLIGYGGLVHIDWDSKNGEISFISATERSRNEELFTSDWTSYLHLLKNMTQRNFEFVKIYTYAYDVRPWLFNTLYTSGFKEEARLRDHIEISGRWHDVRIHSFFFPRIMIRKASKEDAQLYYEWVNEPLVRENSIRQGTIPWEDHIKWFTEKVSSPESTMLVATRDGVPAGQIRFDRCEDGIFEVGISIDNRYRGQGLGAEIIREGIRFFLHEQKDVPTVRARIKATNLASKSSFERAGFKKQAVTENNIELYLLNNPEI